MLTTFDTAEREILWSFSWIEKLKAQIRGRTPPQEKRALRQSQRGVQKCDGIDTKTHS